MYGCVQPCSFHSNGRGQRRARTRVNMASVIAQNDPAPTRERGSGLCDSSFVVLEGFWGAARGVEAAGVRPLLRELEDFEPRTVRRVWQHEASSRVAQYFTADLSRRAPEQVQALVRSEAGPGAGVALTEVHTNRDTRCRFVGMSKKMNSRIISW